MQYGVNVHPHEVQVVLQIVKGLRSCGLDVHRGKGLGVISPYRSQVRALKSGLSSLFSSDKIDNVSCAESGSYTAAKPLSQSSRDVTGVKSVVVDEKRDFRVDDNECEVSTVDSFQGRDMDVVILSTVKNVDEGLVRCMLIDVYCFCHSYACIGISFTFFCFYELTDVVCIRFTYNRVLSYLPYFILPFFHSILPPTIISFPHSIVPSFHPSTIFSFRHSSFRSPTPPFYHSSRVLGIY